MKQKVINTSYPHLISMVAEMGSIGVPKLAPEAAPPSLYERLFNLRNIFLLFIPLVFVVWGIILLVRLRGQNLKLLTIAVVVPLITGIFSLFAYVTILLFHEESIAGLSLFFAFFAGVTSIVLSIISLIKNERTSLHWWVFAYSISYLFVSFILLLAMLSFAGSFGG